MAKATQTKTPKVPKVPPKPLFMAQAINKPKTHFTATSAINQSKTQRKPRFKLQ
jgi:hypothetical protein